MPKPFFLSRASGLYVRFLVPVDLHDLVGTRFIVRPLRGPTPDHARLSAAWLGVALSRFFQELRAGAVVDIEKLLKQHQAGELSNFELRVGKSGTSLKTDGTLGDAQAGQAALVAALAAQWGMSEAQHHPSSHKSPLATVLLSKAIQDYQTDRSNANRTGQLDVANTLGLFLELTGDRPMGQIDDGHTRAFESAMGLWPRNARKGRYKATPAVKVLADVRARQKAQDKSLVFLSDNTRRKHRDTLAAFFNYAVKRKQIHSSPMTDGFRQTDHRISPRQTRRPFNRLELDAIFDPLTFGPWAKEKPHLFWAPWLGLYSGARVNEVAQLYSDDIEKIKDVWGFHVRARRPDQHLKTASSLRFVPLAQPLLDAGFLDYVEDVKASAHARLFPHLKYTGTDYGDYLGDQFGEYLEQIGVKKPGHEGHLGMGFHWFRNGLSTALIGGNIAANTTGNITGHGTASAMPGELDKYVDPSTLIARRKAVNKLRFPTPPKYTRGDFSQALEAAKALPAKWARDDAARAKRNADAEAATKKKKSKG